MTVFFPKSVMWDQTFSVFQELIASNCYVSIFFLKSHYYCGENQMVL